MAIWLIVAISDNNVIGVNNDLPWRLPLDLKWFKMNTFGQSVIMGKKTWESLPKRPLPFRSNYIISRQPKPDKVRAEWHNQPRIALAMSMSKHKHTFIIGGSHIYKLYCESVDMFLVTRVHVIIKSETALTFELPFGIDRIWSSETMEQNGIQFHFEMYRRNNTKLNKMLKKLSKYGL